MVFNIICTLHSKCCQTNVFGGVYPQLILIQSTILIDSHTHCVDEQLATWLYSYALHMSEFVDTSTLVLCWKMFCQPVILHSAVYPWIQVVTEQLITWMQSSLTRSVFAQFIISNMTFSQKYLPLLKLLQYIYMYVYYYTKYTH